MRSIIKHRKNKILELNEEVNEKKLLIKSLFTRIKELEAYVYRLKEKNTSRK